MRNYSEIGCLTLLGVTLTVYVTVGHSAEANLIPDRSAKNVFSQSCDADREGNAYCLSVTYGRCQEQCLALVLPSIPALSFSDPIWDINISESLYIPVIKGFSNSKMPVALPVNNLTFATSQPTTTFFGGGDCDILFLATFELCPEIRAGPLAFFS